jgi:hypothetical protein
MQDGSVRAMFRFVFAALRSNKLYVPLVTVVASMALFAVYYFFYVSWQRTYANERAFRLLTVVGEQLGKKVENFRNVLAASLVAEKPREFLRDVARLREDQLTVQEVDGRCPQNWQREREGVLKLELREQSGGVSLDARFQGLDWRHAPLASCWIRAAWNPSLDLRERFHDLTSDYFDDILVATSAGMVLFESSTSGLRIADLQPLLGSAANPAPKAETAENRNMEKSTPAAPTAAQFSDVREVKFGGSVYKLYMQPLPLNIASRKDGPPLKTVICGLWREDRLQSEVVSIPYSTLIRATLIVLAAFALLWPLLKVACMSPAERLKRAHMFYLLMSGLFVTAILSVIVLNEAYTMRDREEAKEQLKAFADSIQHNVENELGRALNQMADFEKRGSKGCSLVESAPKWTETGVLAKLGKTTYPYFDNVFWADENGAQLFKLTVQKKATPQTSIAKESYFLDVNQNHHLASVGAVKFRFATRNSPNTGEFFVVLAKPAGGDLPRRLQRAKVEVMVTAMISLVNPVVPRGYGFAVVDHEGKAQFHSNSARNQIEDFFKESRDNPALKSVVVNGIDDYVTADYLGRRHLMLTRRLKLLGDPPLTVVVFRDCNYFNTVNVACVLVFGLLAGFYSLPFLVGLAIYILRAGTYPLAHLWPSKVSKVTYARVGLAGICAVAAFAADFPVMGLGRLLAILATIAAAAAFFGFAGKRLGNHAVCLAANGIVVLSLVLCGLERFGWIAGVLYAAFSVGPLAKWFDGRAEKIRGLKPLYLCAVCSVLIVMVVLPCFALFKISYDSVNRLHAEWAQMQRKDLLEHRAEAIQEQLGEAGDASVVRERIREESDRYDDAVFWPTDAPKPVEPFRFSRLERTVASAAGSLPSNGLGAQLRQIAASDAEDKTGLWGHETSGDDEVVVLRIDKDWIGGETEELRGVYPMWQFPAEAAILMAVLAALLAGWLNYMIGRVFLINLAEVPPLEKWLGQERAEHNLLVIGLPKSGKTEWAAPLKRDEADELDLAKVVAAGEPAVPPLTRPTVLIDHFEFDMDNPELCLFKLNLLEKLVYVEKKRIIIVSAIDPMFYLMASCPEIVTPRGGCPEPPAQILDRWAAVLSTFAKREIHDPRKADWSSDAPAELVSWVKEECGHTGQLRKIGRELLDSNCRRNDISKPALLEQLLDRADAYYRVLWSTCTKQERLVLFQLARDGWANPKNDRAIQHLERRSLVKREPGLRIMNVTFCRFVLASQIPAEVANWEEEERNSSWSTVKLALTTAAFMAGAWLLYTQQDVFELGMGYIAAMGTASGAVVSMLRTFAGRNVKKAD